MALKDVSKPESEIKDEFISDDHKVYTAKLAEDLKQVEQMQLFIQKTMGARASWIEHLSKVYNLGPGESITPDGKIVRAQKS